MAVRKVAILPTLLTLGNAVCGFAAIAYASKIGQPDSNPLDDSFFLAMSGWLIVAAMIFDGLDGSVARLSKVTSNFGGELDSLCDAISFGVAPAFLLLRLGPGWDPYPLLHQALAGVATLYMLCAILRLARFNVENSPDSSAHKRFRGLPSPAAAGCIASLAILRGQLPRWTGMEQLAGAVQVWAVLGGLLVALLMVSRLSYPHVVKQLFRGRRHFNHLMQILLAVFVIVLLQELALALLFWSYALGILARYLWVHALHRHALGEPGLDELVRH